MVKKLRNRALVTTTNFYYIDSQYFRMLLAIDYVFKLHTKINLKLFTLPGTYEADFLVRSDSFYSLRDSIQCLSHSLLPHKKMRTYIAIRTCLRDTLVLKKEHVSFLKRFLQHTL